MKNGFSVISGHYIDRKQIQFSTSNILNLHKNANTNTLQYKIIYIRTSTSLEFLTIFKKFTRHFYDLFKCILQVYLRKGPYKNLNMGHYIRRLYHKLDKTNFHIKYSPKPKQSHIVDFIILLNTYF